MVLNPALLVFVVALVVAPVITYRKTKDVKKVLIAIVAVVTTWYVLGLLAHQFME